MFRGVFRKRCSKISSINKAMKWTRQQFLVVISKYRHLRFKPASAAATAANNNGHKNEAVTPANWVKSRRTHYNELTSPHWDRVGALMTSRRNRRIISCMRLYCQYTMALPEQMRTLHYSQAQKLAVPLGKLINYLLTSLSSPCFWIPKNSKTVQTGDKFWSLACQKCSFLLHHRHCQSFLCFVLLSWNQ